jgi:hypothetical protein
MSTYYIERVERICAANTLRRERAKKAGQPVRGLIYDYRVMREGEHIATWRPYAGGGYHLFDLAGRPVRYGEKGGSAHHRTVFARKIASFIDVVHRYGDNIPSRADCIVHNTTVGLRRAKAVAAAKKADGAAKLAYHAPRMLELLRRLDELAALIEVTPLGDDVEKFDALAADARALLQQLDATE